MDPRKYRYLKNWCKQVQPFIGQNLALGIALSILYNIGISLRFGQL